MLIASIKQRVVMIGVTLLMGTVGSLAVGSSQASAATRLPSNIAVGVTNTVAAAAPLSAYCSDPYFGGVFFCDAPGAYGTGESWYQFPNGAWQVFVIGTDRAVWTKWSDASGTSWSRWVSMGGYSLSYAYIASYSANQYDLYLYVIGGDGNFWYRHRGSGSWTNWAPL